MAKTTPQFISKPSTGYNWLLWIGGLVSLYPAHLVLGNLFVEGWFQILNLIFGLLFMGFSLGCFYAIFGMKTYLFYKDRFVSKAFWGLKKQTVFLKDIESWIEIEKENKNIKWKDLTIYTKTEKFCFTSTIDSGYKRIRQKVTKGIKRNRQEEKNWFRRNTIYYCIGFLFFGLLIIGIGLNSFSKKKQPFTFDDLQGITGVIDRIELRKSGGSRGRSKSYWIEMKLQNYQKFDFEIKGIAYRSTDVGGALSNISESEQVSIFILKSEYEMKISKTKKPDFWTRHFYSFDLSVYQLEHQSGTYLDLKGYNFQKMKTAENSTPIFLFLIGFGFIIASIYIYWTMKKELPSYRGTKR